LNLAITVFFLKINQSFVQCTSVSQCAHTFLWALKVQWEVLCVLGAWGVLFVTSVVASVLLMCYFECGHNGVFFENQPIFSATNVPRQAHLKLDA
jgi:hypothetical protein